MANDESADERVNVALHEEVLEPRVQPVELARVRIRKRVEERPVDLTVDTERDDVTIERVPVERPVDVVPEPWQEGDTLVIPVVEEIVVAERKLVVREEIRVTRRRTTEPVPIRTTLRREVIEIDETPT